jgi:hypothetical protein
MQPLRPLNIDLLINFTAQSPYWESDSRADSKGIECHLWNTILTGLNYTNKLIMYVCCVYCGTTEMQAALLPALTKERCEQAKSQFTLFFLAADVPQVSRGFSPLESIRVYPMIKKLQAVHLTAIHFIQREVSVPERPAQLLSCLSYSACQLNHKAYRTNRRLNPL